MPCDLWFHVSSFPFDSPSFPANCGPNVAPHNAIWHRTRLLGRDRSTASLVLEVNGVNEWRPLIPEVDE
jgi:hypothetical protein